ncbi:uncharacterized protein [Nicotiana tomentosiformis]|uniref:uncharacterized protein n=1 Tax=Nicotiana tomentosiformis TaxID=4098 RepID=UPI00388C6263
MSAPPGNWEGKSIARPPLFNGQYYSWWRSKMRHHIWGEDYELWDIVIDGPVATLKKNAERNAKAKKWLICGLGPDEYNRIQGCSNAKQISDTLQVAYDGTTQVKKSRGTLLYSQYENFTIKDGETIQEMYTRFTILTNELKSLGRIIPEEERVEKILTRVLPITWESKIIAIE